jgi:class 3 adenylate cyclase/tetratricopeptide (TPR) repeat protein
VTGERRYLTVLFCDLVNSTAIATQLDPEEWRELIAEYHRVAAEAIERFGGYVAQYQGDGVLAYFGWPQAHDNNAERAARAGLSIIGEIAKLSQIPASAKLSARVGIHSGAVVVDVGRGSKADVFGDTPNIAARVQAAAPPNTVLITADTQRLLSGLFVAEDSGDQALKGIERPIRLYRVIQPSGVRGRLDLVAASRGLTPFVGREYELRLLMDRWELVRQGEGQVISIIGEGGVGKSRLVRRFRERMGETHTWVDAAAGPFFQNTPFYPVVEILNQLRAYGNEPGQGEEQYSKLAPRQEFALARVEFTSQLARLRSVGSLDLLKQAEQPLSPHQRRGLLFKLVEWVLGAAQVEALIIAIEDLHWADASTLELIQLLVGQGKNASLLLLCTARPEFRASWPQTQITLTPLSAYDTRSMVEHVAGQKTLAEDTVTTVVERTGGVPLFVEELTRAVLESGAAKPTEREIPVTLHDSLMARLDRLGPAKEVLQVGAVIGNEFSYELLRAVHPVAEQDLQESLWSAANAGLLYLHGIVPDATCQIKHALIRDAAYEALLKSRRRELHTRIAQTIEERFSGQAASHPEILAHHYTEGGLIEQAVRYWRKAGQKASERSANAEAIGHFAKGIELLGTLPPNLDIKREEIRLQNSLINPLIAIEGYTSSEVERACTRARELCRELGDPPQLFAVLGGLFAVYHNRGEFRIASEIAEQMLRRAETLRESRLLMWSYYSLGVNSEAQGALPSARTYLEQSLALYDAGQRKSYGFVQDPNVTGSGLLAHVLHALGYPDQALEKSHKALSHARKLAEPYTLAWAIGATAALHVRRREYLKGSELATELIAICIEHGFLPYSAEGHVWCGLALVQEGRGEEGVARILQGLTIGVTAIQQRLFELYLAVAYWQMGCAREGLLTVEKSLAQMSDEAYNTMPELFRLKGELLLIQHADEVEAERCVQRAIEIARTNTDRTAELQATTTLARLWHNTGRRGEARTMLAEIYNWFTEGFDTADLKEAKALLDELNR